jgi:hypothetical protein
MRQVPHVGFALTVGAALLVAGLLTAGGAAGREAAPSRIIDRSLVCDVTERAGVRVLELAAQSGGFQEQHPVRLEKLRTAPASVSLSTGFGFASEKTELVSAAAGQGDAGSVSIGRSCTSVTRKLPLTSRGLKGGAASRMEARYECVTPARIVVRVRAVFGAPRSLRRDPRSGSLSAEGTVKASYVAARTLRGRPLIFASMQQSGKTRLFMMASCVKDAN